jgi:hypothetical protein
MTPSMSFTRRALTLLPLVAAAFVPSGAAQAQAAAYPSKPITLIVASAPGGTTDLAARMLADPLGKALGQTVVVDNRAGASGGIAAVAVKRADADGHTLLMQYSGYHVITPAVTKQPLGWEAKDFQPVANVLSAPQLVVVRAGLPIKTMADLIAYAKANPGKLTYASSGNGSLQHVTGAMIEQQAGIQMTHIPYKGTGPALQDLLGNQVDVTFGTPPPYMPHIQRIGGCPYAPGSTGNVATEDVVHMLQCIGYDTGLDLPGLIAAAATLETLVEHPLPALVSRAGPRLTRHAPPADFEQIAQRAHARDGEAAR